MGRPTMPKGDHKTTMAISVKKLLLKRIDDLRGQRTRSAFVSSILEMNLFSEKAYASYMWRHKQLEAAYWEYEFKKKENGERIRRDQIEITEY